MPEREISIKTKESSSLTALYYAKNNNLTTLIQFEKLQDKFKSCSQFRPPFLHEELRRPITENQGLTRPPFMIMVIM